MNDPNSRSDKKAESPAPTEPVAFNPFTPFGPIFRNAAAAIDQTRDLITGFTNLLNPFANSSSSPPAKAITAKSADESSGELGAAVAVDHHTAESGTLPAKVDDAPSTGDGALGAILGTVGRVASHPVAMAAEALRQVQQVQQGVAPSQAIDNVVNSLLGTTSRDETDQLRKRGEALIRVSCKPEYQRRDVHPSFSNILDELLPDEARILRFLAVAGTQPAIDVRTKSLFQIGSVKLAGGVNMIAEMAGCKWPDRAYHYLANLSRLGLIDFSKEPVEDYRRYALLEVQPAATTAIARAPKSISIYRSIALTSFGRQFVDLCIDTGGYDGGGWATDGREDKILGKGPPA